MGIETATTATADGILATCRQRYVLYCLHRHSERMKLADIADQITVWETDRRGEAKPDKRLQIYNSLYHEYIPALSDSNIVAYDQRTDMVELTANRAEIRQSIEQRFRQEFVGLLESECKALEPGEQT